MLVAALDALDDKDAIISTVYPAVAHDPYIAELVRPTGGALHWVDARFALLLPAGSSSTRLVISASTPPHPAFGIDPGSAAVTTVQLRATDLDPAFDIIALDAQAQAATLAASVQPPSIGTPAILDKALELLGARWLGTAQPGGVAELLTVWRVHSAEVGPRVPPAAQTDVVLFTHVLRPEGGILVQRDDLHAPSWQWQPGDVIAQVHRFSIAADTPAGTYQAVAGMYDRASGIRATLPDGNDVIEIVPLIITP